MNFSFNRHRVHPPLSIIYHFANVVIDDCGPYRYCWRYPGPYHHYPYFQSGCSLALFSHGAWLNLNRRPFSSVRTDHLHSYAYGMCRECVLRSHCNRFQSSTNASSTAPQQHLDNFPVIINKDAVTFHPDIRLIIADFQLSRFIFIDFLKHFSLSICVCMCVCVRWVGPSFLIHLVLVGGKETESFASWNSLIREILFVWVRVFQFSYLTLIYCF